MDAIFLFIALVEFAITVLVLIKFFRLCSDVSRLKEAIDPDIDTCEESEFEHRFYLYLAAGEKERAKDLLFKECQKFSGFGAAFRPDANTAYREEFMENAAYFFDAVDVKIDFSRIDSKM